MRLYITRHGETLQNLEQRLMGHLPGTLSPKGLEQARKLALRLIDERFDIIYSSDLKRAADTTLEISKYHLFTRIVFTDRIRERFMGSYEGKIKDNFPELKNIQAGNFEAPDGEKLKDMYQRAAEFISFLKKDNPNSNVLLVGHNGINKGLIGNALGLPFEKYTSLPIQKNCGLNIIEIEGDKSRVILENSYEHLE